MHPAVGPAWLVWLETSGLAATMRQSAWLYPIVEIVHIAGFVLLVGATVLFDLRVLGAGAGLPVASLARQLLPWSWAGLVLAAPAGAMMFSAHATEFALNPAFLTKITLLALAGINAAYFHARPYRSVDAWRSRAEVPFSARVSALASIALWVGVITCGRLIAYF